MNQKRKQCPQTIECLNANCTNAFDACRCPDFPCIVLVKEYCRKCSELPETEVACKNDHYEKERALRKLKESKENKVRKDNKAKLNLILS